MVTTRHLLHVVDINIIEVSRFVIRVYKAIKLWLEIVQVLDSLQSSQPQ